MSLTGAYTVLAGQSYVLIDNTGANPIDGTFSGLPQGAVIPNVLSSGLPAFVSYYGGDGNDFTITVGETTIAVDA